MTPEQLAQNMARSGHANAQALAVAMIARSLSDHDPADPYRQGWPVSAALPAACTHLGLTPTTQLIDAARALMPVVGDGLMNRKGA